jgi:hypothetical protein
MGEDARRPRGGTAWKKQGTTQPRYNEEFPKRKYRKHKSGLSSHFPGIPFIFPGP